MLIFSKGHLEGSIEITSKTGQSVKFTGKFAENLLWKLFTCFGGSFEKMNSTSQSGLTDAQRDKVWPIVDAIINGALKNSTTCSASLIESRVATPMEISQDSARSLDGLPGIDGRINHITPEVTAEKQARPRALNGIGIEGKEMGIREHIDVNESSDHVKEVLGLDGDGVGAFEVITKLTPQDRGVDFGEMRVENDQRVLAEPINKDGDIKALESHGE